MKEKDKNILKLTIQEATEKLLLSQSTIYSWIDKGKLNAEETSSGKIIVISKKDVGKIRENSLKLKKNKENKNNFDEVLTDSDLPVENSVIDVEYTKNEEKIDEYSINFHSESDTPEPTETEFEVNQKNTKNSHQHFNGSQEYEIAKLVAELSAKAGKYELLADLQKQNEQDAKYWQTEFFKLQAQNAELKAKLEVLQSQLKKKSFFSIFSKD